ncbi:MULTISPECIES: hypothetical protein [unclassified Streptomyces]|uniref:hypothetical protein n=1 Tax=unclassified Streptomyces TaxID=2593676 RepID=UPI0022B6DD89|nr:MULTISPECIES: hypothetical protein [unclassified Streptomyces]MCZ7416449.1 hypothetical protein [Streptomyces sp. WMMC897]MCZ7433740.1 hypothetical protein [Streptomyces sp. WMMC1477]
MTSTAAVAHGLPLITEVLGEALERCRTTALDGGLTAYVVDNPRQNLSVSAHHRVYDALVPVTTQSFEADMTPYWAQRSKEGYLERLAEFVLVADEEGAIVGWTGHHLLRFDERVIVYLDSTGMVPRRQSKGTMRKLMGERVAEAVLPSCPGELPVYLTARTESPIFYRLMRGLVDGGTVFPHPSTPLPADVAACGVSLATWLGQRHILEPSTLTLRNAYDALDELYGELPTTGDPELDAMFRGTLGPLDAFLIISRIR